MSQVLMGRKFGLSTPSTLMTGKMFHFLYMISLNKFKAAQIICQLIYTMCIWKYEKLNSCYVHNVHYATVDDTLIITTAIQLHSYRIKQQICIILMRSKSQLIIAVLYLHVFIIQLIALGIHTNSLRYTHTIWNWNLTFKAPAL